jgi:MFS family permease
MPDFLRRFGQRHKNGEYYFSNVRAGLIVGMLSIGTLFGALLAAPLADRIGRRISIIVWCGIFCVGMIVQLSSTDEWYQVRANLSYPTPWPYDIHRHQITLMSIVKTSTLSFGRTFSSIRNSFYDDHLLTISP